MISSNNKLDFLNIINESEEGFRIIAEKLINEYVIQTYNSKYRMVELEFYWNSSTHVDKSTYNRNHVDPNTGEWFFHYSGVDIALKNKNGYGGILIRSVCDLNDNNKLYKGPMVCAMRLFSGTNAFENTNQPIIILNNSSEAKMNNSVRIGLGNNSHENGANKFQYRFFIDPIRK